MAEAGLHFDWNPVKAASNIRDHEGVTFPEASEVFGDPLNLDREDDREYPDGPRFITLGMTLERKLLVVVYTESTPNHIHIISARRATQHERRNYEDLG